MRRTALNRVHALARRDERVVFIGSDLGPGTLDAMKEELPERFFMEGVAEANLIGMAAGMAMEGFVPYVNTIASFLTRRCLEQVMLDVCLHDLPVRLIGNGGGLVYAPLGPTHNATEDIALMRALPGMTVVAVTDADEMTRLIDASLDWPNPMYIRLAKGGDAIVSRPEDGFTIGRAIELRAGSDVLIVACGVMVQRSLAAAELLSERGISSAVLNMHTVAPLDIDAVVSRLAGTRLLVTVEEHVSTGGLGSAVTDALVEAIGRVPAMLRCAIPQGFYSLYGSQDSALEHFSLQPEGLATRIAARLEGGQP